MITDKSSANKREKRRALQGKECTSIKAIKMILPIEPIKGKPRFGSVATTRSP